MQGEGAVGVGMDAMLIDLNKNDKGGGGGGGSGGGGGGGALAGFPDPPGFKSFPGQPLPPSAPAVPSAGSASAPVDGDEGAVAAPRAFNYPPQVIVVGWKC